MEIKLTLSNLEARLLENDLLNIQDWFEEAKLGKINNCTKRFLKEWQQKLMADPSIDSIPANEEDFINLVTSRPDYKNRVEREAEKDAT